MFSDGYADQFGGENARKLKMKAFKQLLLENRALPMVLQKEMLQSFHKQWQGSLGQTDDICILGIEF